MKQKCVPLHASTPELMQENTMKILLKIGMIELCGKTQKLELKMIYKLRNYLIICSTYIIVLLNQEVIMGVSIY